MSVPGRDTGDTAGDGDRHSPDSQDGCHLGRKRDINQEVLSVMLDEVQNTS